MVRPAAARATAARFRQWVSSAAFVLFITTSAGAATPEQTALAQTEAAWRRGDLKAAHAFSLDALRAFAASDADEIWSLRVLHGEILGGVSSCADAQRYLAALKLPARLARSKVAVDRHLALAAAANRCNATAIAKDSFAAAQKIAAGNDAMLGSVLVRKSDFEIVNRAWAAAERDIETLLNIARRTNTPRLESRAWAARGKLRGQQERFDEAIDDNQRALEIATAGDDIPLSLAVRLNLGWLYVASGDYDNAVDILTAVDAEYARLGRKTDRIIALLQLGNAALAQERLSAARTHYTAALALARELNHRTTDTLLANLARVQYESGDFAAARFTNDEALALKHGRGDADEQRSLITAARIDAASGNGAAAERTFARVIADAKSRIVLWEALIFSAIFHDAAGAAKTAEAEYRRALAMSEEARKELKSDELKLAFPTTQRRLFNEYVSFLVRSGRASDALAVAEQSRARTLTDALGIGPARSAQIDARQIAKQNGVVLSYWLTPSRSFLWTVTPREIKVASLPPEAEIARAVDGYLTALAGPRGSLEQSGARGEELWQMLIAPATAALRGATRVLIVPDKRLHALNFETIVAPGARAHYWIEDVTITTASSLQLIGRNKTASGKSMLLVGNPPVVDSAFPSLPQAASEIQRVRAHFTSATIVAGPAATPGAYTSLIKTKFGFVHFVAHGVGSTVRPLDSAIVLGRDASGYKLYAREIVQHRLAAQLVTISSCHGAGQRAYAGEGLVGLAWAFLRAGAHQVVAALWEVSDSATPQLMDSMYAEIARGADPADALRAAKLTMLRSSGVYRRPLYWAPFVLYSGS